MDFKRLIVMMTAGAFHRKFFQIVRVVESMSDLSRG